MAEVDGSASGPVFRTSKRRKIMRKRLSDDEEQTTNPQTTLSAPAPVVQPSHVPVDTTTSSTQQQDESLSVAEILRRRKLGKSQARRVGIEFSNSSSHHAFRSASVPAQPQASDALVPVQEQHRAVEAAANRFAPQTGKVVDVLDKHMVEYIDSKMAELRHNLSIPASSASLSMKASAGVLAAATENSTGEAQRQRQPAGLGKLQEIDLGPDATAQNIARTEAATKMFGAFGERTQSQEAEKSGKVRMGRDGKPWRGRKRRNSEDIKRDRLVEEVLRESRLELYDEPEATVDVDGDQAADDLIAERFRREFIDAIESRNIRRTAPAPPGVAKGAKGEDKPKGPKLGGSRSARAAMRALEEKAAKKR